jgi:transcriptional regulator with XRE-family HTH domain
MHIGQVIRSLREQKEWSQEKLALEVGMGTSHISRIERGERRLPTSRLDAIATALSTTPAAMFAELEGLPPPLATADQSDNQKVDFSAEAIELRKTFRKLSMPSRRLVVDFAHMLAKQAQT